MQAAWLNAVRGMQNIFVGLDNRLHLNKTERSKQTSEKHDRRQQVLVQKDRKNIYMSSFKQQQMTAWKGNH